MAVDSALETTSGMQETALDSILPSHTFRIVPLGPGRARIEVVRDGEETGGFDLAVFSPSTEATFHQRVQSLGIAYPDDHQRDFDAYKVLSEARRMSPFHDPESVHQAAAEERANELLIAGDLTDRLRDDAIKVGFEADPDVGVLLILCKISALLNEPVYVYLSGPASTLKTWYADRLADLTPPEFLKHLTDLTPKALYYGACDLRHFVIALDEMDLKGGGLAMDRKVLRMLFSKGWCEIEVTRGGKSVRRRVEGPVMVVQTTTAVEFDEQDLSRHLLIELADSPDRTDVVLGIMGRHYAGEDHEAEVRSIIETHHAVHRLLPVGAKVDVPFAPALAELMPRDRIKILRTFRTLLNLVKASALIHVRQRDRNEHEIIQASLDDYRIVYGVAEKFLAQSMAAENVPGPASAWVADLLLRRGAAAQERANAGEDKELALRNRMGNVDFAEHSGRWATWLTVGELVTLTERPRATVQRYVTQLELAGLVEREKHGRTVKFRLATADGQLPTGPRLPTPEEVERGHLGISHKSAADNDMIAPPAVGQPTVTGANHD